MIKESLFTWFHAMWYCRGKNTDERKSCVYYGKALFHFMKPHEECKWFQGGLCKSKKVRDRM